MIESGRLMKIYESMLTIRAFEERAKRLFERNVVRGSVHLYIGEEAIAATFCSLLREDDSITSTHRGHGHCIAKGADLGRTLAELMGRESGYCRGRAGSMHIADVTRGNLGANAIVGGGIPIATGAGLAASLKNTDQVVVSFFGDGAANQGVFHESLNLAALWKLPVVYVCENNGFAISVPLAQSTSVERIAVRAASYGMPGFTVDGNDVFAVNDAAEAAIARARAGGGPSLIECRTYRWEGHWTGDPQVYRSREEVRAWKERCPIKRLRNHLVDHAEKTPEELDALARRVERLVDEAERFATESAQPDPARVMDDVFSG